MRGGRRRSDNRVVLSDGRLAHVHTRCDNGEAFTCYPIVTSCFSTDSFGLDLPWHLAGVYKYEGIDDTSPIHVKRTEVVGKLMLCGGYLTEWRAEWMMSKGDH